jgi:hypothetical protein
VLYPFSLDIKFLRRIYARHDEDTDQIAGILAGLNLSIDVTCDASKFRS